MATILCAAHPNEGKGKHLEYWEEGGGATGSGGTASYTMGGYEHSK
jgi:hypothetical protein